MSESIRTGTGRWTRRALLAGLVPALAGCTASARFEHFDVGLDEPVRRRRGAVDGYDSYGEIDDGRFVIEALDVAQMDPDNLRRLVAWRGPERPGTIVIDPRERWLHLVRDDGSAIRYGVGVGREGFEWSGRATIGRKAEWPTWTPPREMTLRDAEAARWASGMPGGPDNPLGARALYLHQGSRDTLYRIHGTNDPTSIGEAMSSGCIRLLNHDIVDLYARVTIGTPVVVLG